MIWLQWCIHTWVNTGKTCWCVVLYLNFCTYMRRLVCHCRRKSSGIAASRVCDRTSLFAYWLWSCVVTVLILLTKYRPSSMVAMLNYFLNLGGFPWACSTFLQHGLGISLAAMNRALPNHTHTTPILCVLVVMMSTSTYYMCVMWSTPARTQ